MANEKPTITIDGRVLEFEPGQTVIQIARANGIDIPHYCYHPGLSIVGNCRICMVEVDGWPRPNISCKLPAAAGMVVHTQSDLARSAREGTMEMLLVNHPLDCPICDQAGECELQDYSYTLGQGASRANTPKTKHDKNVPFGAKIVYDGERCIKCTQCVRFCEEITQTHELSMSERSDHEQVIMTRKGEFDTPYAMNIIDICPVGALTSRDFRFKSRLWFMDFAPSICTSCARGCNITTGGREGTFLRMEPRENQQVNKWWMCDPGRLDYKFVNTATRLQVPHVRDDSGALREASWEEAITAAAAALRDAPAGRDVLLDGNCSLEEMALAKALAAAMGGQARYAAHVGEDGDDFLIVNEKGANARGGETLGLERAMAPGAAAVLIVERDRNVPAALRDASGAVVAFAMDGEHVPDSAKVAFPFGSWAERDGLLVNVDGRVQEIRRNLGVGPVVMTPAIEVLEDLVGELDDNYDWQGREGLVTALRALPVFADVEFPDAFPSKAAGVGANA